MYIESFIWLIFVTESYSGQECVCVKYFYFDFLSFYLYILKFFLDRGTQAGRSRAAYRARMRGRGRGRGRPYYHGSPHVYNFY